MQIKKITVKACPPSTANEYLSTETFYDERGNEIEFRRYAKGKIIIWEKYSYGKDDELLRTLKGVCRKGTGYRESDFQFSPKQPQRPTRTIHYPETEEINEQGQKVITTFAIKEQTLRERKIYDSEGQLLESRKFKSDGTPLNYLINTYNDLGQIIYSKRISRTGVIHDTVYKYNSEGLLIEEIEAPKDRYNAYADRPNSCSGYSHKYFYDINKLMEADHLYLTGNLIMVYRYYYWFWE